MPFPPQKRLSSFPAQLLLIGLLLTGALPACARQGVTARAMEAQGMVNILDVDSTIHVSLMYSRADNFVGRVLYTDLREAYLHPLAAQALARAQRILKARRPDLSLKVYDACRPMSIQQQMWNTVAGTPKQNYVSNPRNGGGLHNYGMAVDVTLCLAQTGDTISMGTKIDFLGSRAHIDREEQMVRQGQLLRKEKAHRMLLRQVMREAGFTPLRSEWWHFNLISRAEARSRFKAVE